MPPHPAVGAAPVPDLGLSRLGVVSPDLLPGEPDFAAALVRFAPANLVPRAELAVFFLLRGAPDPEAASVRADRYTALRDALASFVPTALHGVPACSDEPSLLYLPPQRPGPRRAGREAPYWCSRCDQRETPTGRELCEPCEQLLALAVVERQASEAIGLGPTVLARCLVCGDALPFAGALVCPAQSDRAHRCRLVRRRLYERVMTVVRTLSASDWSPPTGQKLLRAPPHDGRPFARAFAEVLHSTAADRHLAPELPPAPPVPGPDDALLPALGEEMDAPTAAVPFPPPDGDSVEDLATPPSRPEDPLDTAPPRTVTMLPLPRRTRGRAALADASMAAFAGRDFALHTRGAMQARRHAMVGETLAAVVQSAASFEYGGFAVAPLPYRGLAREHVPLEGFRAHLSDVPDVRVTACVRPLGGLRTVHGTGISEPPSERFAMYRLELRDEEGVDIHEVQLEVAPGAPAPVYLWHRESAGRVPREDGTVARSGDHPLPALAAGTDIAGALDVFACAFAAWVRYVTGTLSLLCVA